MNETDLGTYLAPTAGSKITTDWSAICPGGGWGAVATVAAAAAVTLMLSESDAARILILVRLGVAGSTSASEKTNERLCQQIVFKLFKTDVVYRYSIKISLK